MVEKSMASLALALLLAGTAAGQGAGVLGKDNADFARKLFEADFPDLAEGLCKTIEKQGATGSELLAIQALGFEIQFDGLRRNSDLAARIAGLQAVLDGQNAFIKENARTSVADVVRTNLPTVYLELAAALTRARDEEKDVAKKAELTEQGQRIFEEGKAALRERIELFRAQLDQGTGNVQRAEFQLLLATFNLAKMDYQHSLLHPQGSPERQNLLETALEEFRDFGFDFGGTPQSYLGIIFQGLCHEGLGLDEEALTDFEDAFKLREDFLFEDGQYQVGPDEADMLSAATLQRVELLTRLKRRREAVAAADEYLLTIPDALLASAGLRVLEAKAKAEIAAGDVTAASVSAEALVDLDPDGAPGRMGRALLSQLPVFNLAPDKILGIAETSAQRGEFARALDLCRRARETVRGARDEQEVGALSYFLTGNIYRSQRRLHEASLAYDCAADLYPKGARAPDALNSAVNTYRELAKADKARFYSERANERMNKLASKYPQHPAAANVGIFQGLRREDDGDFAGAIQFYEKVEPSSSSFHEASFRLAAATYQLAQSLMKDKAGDAQPLLQKSEELYEKSIELLTKAQEDTLDTAVQQRLGNWLFNARVGLSRLRIDVGRPGEIRELLSAAEAKAGSDPDKVAEVWTLRIRGLEAEGKVDEAVRLFDALIQGTPDAPAIPRSAGVLARALDTKAAALHEKDPAGAERLWRKAAGYYTTSVERALKGTSALDAADVGEVAQRLYSIGLYLNQVPEGQTTFVDWQGTVVDTDLWEKAAEIYRRLDQQAPSYRIAIERARTLAILGRIPEAETIYARLFDQQSMFAPGSERFDSTLIENRPELISAYLEWGVATHVVGLDTKDQGRLDRAGQIYGRSITNSSVDYRSWWQAKYFQIKLESDRGNYDLADTAIRSTKRTTHPQYDQGKFGFKDRFLALEQELSKKVFSRPKPPGG